MSTSPLGPLSLRQRDPSASCETGHPKKRPRDESFLLLPLTHLRSRRGYGDASLQCPPLGDSNSATRFKPKPAFSAPSFIGCRLRDVITPDVAVARCSLAPGVSAAPCSGSYLAPCHRGNSHGSFRRRWPRWAGLGRSCHLGSSGSLQTVGAGSGPRVLGVSETGAGGGWRCSLLGERRSLLGVD